MMLQITPRVVEGGSLVAGADATMVTAVEKAEKATRPVGAATQMPQRTRTPKTRNAATGADATTTTAIGRATRPVKAGKTTRTPMIWTASKTNASNKKRQGGERRPQRPAAGRSQTRRSSTGAFSPKAF